MTIPVMVGPEAPDADVRPAEAVGPTSGARSLHLDLMRAAAVLLVIGHHMIYPPRDVPELIRKPLVLWRIGGWVGVDLFFVLSGFLVSGLLFREHRRRGQFRIGRFLIRRGFKIYPPFYLFLGLTTLLALALDELPPIHNFVYDIFFLQNYFGSHWQHTWSLAVEEHFYLFLPLLLLVMLRSSRDTRNAFAKLPAVFIAMALITLALRVHASLYVMPTVGHITPTHLRIDSLMFGVLLAYYYHYHHESFVRIFSWRPLLLGLGAAGAIVGVALLPRPSLLLHSLGLSVNFFASGVLLGVLTVLPDTKNRALRAIAFVGANSYSIYLWHEVVRRYVRRFASWATGVELSWAGETVLYMSFSIVVGVLGALAVERPMLAIRDRLAKVPQ